jgi:hypothetical protein
LEGEERKMGVEMKQGGESIKRSVKKAGGDLKDEER